MRILPKRFRRWPLIAAIAVLAAAVAIGPLARRLREYLERELEEILGGRLSIGAVFYRAPLSLAARDISLRGNDETPDGPIVSAPRGVVAFRPVLSPRPGLRVSRLEFDGARINIRRDEKGNWNFIPHVRAIEASSKPGGKPRIFFLPRLYSRNSRFVFSDRALNFDKTIAAASLELDLSSLPGVVLSLSGDISGDSGRLEIEGDLKKRGDALHAKAHFGALDLIPYLPYLDNLLGPVKLDRARASEIQASLELTPGSNFSMLIESSLRDLQGTLEASHSFEGSARTTVKLHQNLASAGKLDYRVEIVPEGLRGDGIGLPRKIELDRGLLVVSPRGFWGEDLAGESGEKPFSAQGDWTDWRESGLKTRLQILGWSFDLNLSPQADDYSFFQISGSAPDSKLTAEGQLFNGEDFQCQIKGEVAMKDLTGFLPPIPGEDNSRLRILGGLDGPLGKPEDWRGWASLEISEGKIWDLPLFQGLWQILVLFQPNLRKMSFYHIQGDFDIREGRVITTNLKMNSVNIGLLAQGELTFSGKLDYEIWLKFFPESGSVFTIVSDGIAELVGTVIHVKLGGNLEKPAWRPALSLIEHYPKKLGRFFRRLLPF